MSIEVVRHSERDVAQPIRADEEMGRLLELIDGSSPGVPKDEPQVLPRRCEPTWFRALFLGIADDCSPLALGTVDLRASDAPTAMREAICMPWPSQAIGFRLLDLGRLGVGRP